MSTENQPLHRRINELERTLSHLRQSVAREQLHRWSIRNELLELITKIEDAYHHRVLDSPIPTGFHEYDRLTNGLHPGELTLVAGLPGSGKTAFATSLLQNVSLRSKQPALVFSLHQPARQLLLRTYCALAEVPISRVRNAAFAEKDDFTSLQQAARKLSDCPLFMDETRNPTIWDLIDISRQYREEEGIQIVVIDYLQLLRLNTSGPEGKRKQEVTEITDFLKQLATDLNISIVALTQLGHSVKLRSAPTPTVAHLREFGEIENIADVVALLNRNGSDCEDETEVHLVKHAMGPTGRFRLRFRPDLAHFENLPALAH